MTDSRAKVLNGVQCLVGVCDVVRQLTPESVHEFISDVRSQRALEVGLARPVEMVLTSILVTCRFLIGSPSTPRSPTGDPLCVGPACASVTSSRYLRPVRMRLKFWLTTLPDHRRHQGLPAVRISASRPRHPHRVVTCGPRRRPAATCAGGAAPRAWARGRTCRRYRARRCV